MRTRGRTLIGVLAVMCTSACCDLDVSGVSLEALPSPELQASITPEAATTSTDLNLTYRREEGRCLDVPGAAAEVAGNAMTRTAVYVAKGCDCAGYPKFSWRGTTPEAGPATYAVVEGATTLSMTLAAAFDARTVALRAPATSLTPGQRVYLDLAPASDQITDLAVAFYPQGSSEAAFRLGTGNGVTRDDVGWSFVVPAATPGSGRLEVWTPARLAVAQCQGASACSASGQFTRSVETAITP